MVSNHSAHVDHRLAIHFAALARPLSLQLHCAALVQLIPNGPVKLRAGEKGPVWIRVRDKLLPPNSTHSTNCPLLVGQGLRLVQTDVHTVPSHRTFRGQVPIYANLICADPLLARHTPVVLHPVIKVCPITVNTARPPESENPVHIVIRSILPAIGYDPTSQRVMTIPTTVAAEHRWTAKA